MTFKCFSSAAYTWVETSVVTSCGGLFRIAYVHSNSRFTGSIDEQRQTIYKIEIKFHDPSRLKQSRARFHSGIKTFLVCLLTTFFKLVRSRR